MISVHTQFALAHPVYDPLTQIVSGHFWQVDRRKNLWSITAGLTVNIGRE